MSTEHNPSGPRRRRSRDALRATQLACSVITAGVGVIRLLRMFGVV